ncbi:hypothetical protein KGO95_04455 [Patescibacteria group bacterium]|nr:hypothetical protein [Patescibacteria group bacterium]
MRFTKNLKTITTISGIVILIYAGVYMLVGRVFVPANFIESRAAATVTSRQIMTLINNSLATLSDIDQLDQSHDYTKALPLVNQEIATSTQSIALAQTFASQIDAMDNATLGITPDNVKAVAVNAIKDQMIPLIQSLIAYNTSFKAMLSDLKLKFSGDPHYDPADFQTQLDTLNKAVNDINTYNTSYNQQMTQFDSMTK